MGTVIGILIVGIMILSAVSGLIWLFTSRSYPLRQKTPPDLSSFQRDRESLRPFAAAVEQAMQGGIVGQSLRQVAAAIDTSHRMLLYHFGSREGLLVAISNVINEDVAGALDRWKGPRELFVHRWIGGLAGELVKAGADQATARTQARLHLAVARGLLLDLLATEERAEVGQAYEYYLQLTGHAAEQSPGKRPDGPAL